jgi:1,4-alpha-glucan branching enzyme
MTFSMIYAYSEHYVLPLSHDEVVHGKGSLLRKMAGDEWRQFAGLRSLLAFMWAHPGKQLLFMGSEFGQGDEWSEQAGLQWHLLEYPRHAGVQQLVKDLNAAYTSQPALWQQDSSPAGFEWIDANDWGGNVLSFVRYGADGSMLACVCNFSATPHRDYRIGLPSAGRWTEVLNTDAEIYGGADIGNFGGVDAVAEPWHGRPASASLSIPPLGVIWLTQERPPTAVIGEVAPATTGAADTGLAAAGPADTGPTTTQLAEEARREVAAELAEADEPELPD